MTIPCYILGIANLFMQDLWNSRRCLNKIEGLDHSVVNATLGACGDLPEAQEGPCLPYFVWQCGEIKVSNLHGIMFFKRQGAFKVEENKIRFCHGWLLSPSVIQLHWTRFRNSVKYSQSWNLIPPNR